MGRIGATGRKIQERGTQVNKLKIVVFKNKGVLKIRV